MFLEELEAEHTYLLQLSQKAQAEISASPGGSLRITHSNGYPIYFHRKSSTDKNGEYISASNIQLARDLAQKEYSKKILKSITHRSNHIEALIAEYRNHDFANVFESYNPARRSLITPYVISDAAYARQWLETPYEPYTSHPESLLFETSEGLKVRSKSEQIIAENLMRLGIPFKYEAPLYISNRTVFHPDFTLLNAHRRSIIYYEHFGKMGDPEYMDYFFRKVKIYNKLGLVQGKNLIFTFEDKDHPFDFSSHKHIFEDLLLK